jgi:hypothetical protein
MTTLDYEIERFTQSTGELVAWVRIPSLATTADTKLWMYYGNPGAAAPAASVKHNTWNSGYKGVWHMSESPSNPSGTPTRDIKDSTVFANDGTSQGTMATAPSGQVDGKTGKGLNFDGTDDYLYTEDAFANPQALTLEAWVKTSNKNGKPIFSFEAGQTAAYAGTDYDRALYLNNSGYGALNIWDDANLQVASYASDLTVGAGWHHLVGTYAPNTLTIYVDGVNTGTDSAAQAQTIASGWWKLAARRNANAGGNGSDGYFGGNLDEMRFSDVVRSAAWVSTGWRNQNTPSTFSSVGAEQARSSAAHTIWWQVVEFTNASDISVQRGVTSMASGSSSVAPTVTAVDQKRSFALVDFASSGSGAAIGQRALRARITADNTLTIDRSVTGVAVEDIAWQVVELKDGTRVQSGSAAFASGGGGDIVNATLTMPVDTTRATGFASVQYGGGAAMGSTSYVTDDYLGVATASVEVTSSTNVRLTRGSTVGAADIGWFVVEWGGPAAWSASYAMRKLLTIAATTAAPTGYTTSVTFDHAAMVTAGQSLSSGNDVRVVRYGAGGWTELDRVIDDSAAWNTTTTKVWFKTAAAVGTNASDYSYYLHYANPAAGAPPVSKGNIYTFTDGFETGDTSGWTAPGSGAAANWYADASWTKRKLITLTAGQISGSNSSFPVLISVTDASLAAARADGYDLLFTDGDGTTKLDHQIESFTQGTGALVAWVRKPTLSSAANTLYLYYGHASAADQQSATAVWDTNYKSVWHLKESPAGVADEIKDSTSTANHGYGDNGMTAGDQVAGKIGGSLNFDGDAAWGEYITTKHLFTDPALQTLTVEAWVKTATRSGKPIAALEAGQWDDYAGASYDRQLSVTTNGYGAFTINDSSAKAAAVTSVDITNGNTGSTWHHIVGTYTATTVKVYVDGVNTDTNTASSAKAFNGYWKIAANLNAYNLGADGNTVSGWFPGTIDEVRISDSVRSADWIATQYQNQNNPGSFITVSPEQSPSVGWYDAAWSYRKKITLTSAQISSGPHSNFPVLISISGGSYPELTNRAKTQADFDDILFASSNGTTKLAHEIETYNSATGSLVAWVKLPTLSTGARELYMYYGNSSATAQQNVAPVASAVWSNSYLAVYHMHSDPAGGSLTDSTSIARHGTRSGGTTPARETAKIGQGWHFGPEDNSDYVALPAMGDQAAATVQAWLSVDAFTDGNAGVVSRNGFTNGSVHFKANNPNISTDAAGGGSAVAAISTGTWYQTAYSYTKNNLSGLVLFKNADAPLTSDAGNFDWQGTGLEIGHEHTDYAQRQFDGLIDEVRISSVARSAGWLATEYNNTNNPAGFHTFAAEENAPVISNSFSAATDQKRSGSYALKVAPVTSAGDLLIANGISLAGVQFDAWWRLSTTSNFNVAQAVRLGSTSPTNAYEGAITTTGIPRAGKEISGTYTNFADAANNSCPSSGAWAKVSVLIQGTSMKVLCGGTQVVPQGGGWSATGAELASGSVGFRASAVPSGENWWVDDVTARQLVEPEPAATLGSLVDRP